MSEYSVADINKRERSLDVAMTLARRLSAGEVGIVKCSRCDTVHSMIIKKSHNGETSGSCLTCNMRWVEG